MATVVSWLTVLLALAVSAQQQRYQHNPWEGFGSRTDQAREQSLPADYNYSYDVRDDTTGDRKSQEESRSGDRVRGRYSFLDADGSTRTVEYTVDSHSGFNAVVRRDGDQISLPNLHSRAFQVSQDDAQSRRPVTSFEGGRYLGRQMNSNSRTRLAQDARTGNVVDLHSGFGALSQVRSNQNEQQSLSLSERQFAGQEQFSPLDYTAQGVARHHQHDVQEIFARSQYQASHPHNHQASTAPIHFPLYRANYNPQLRQQFSNRITSRPTYPVDIRTPVAILPNSDAQVSRTNDRQGNEQPNSNFPSDNNPFNNNEVNQPNAQYLAQQEVIRVPTTPVPSQSFELSPQIVVENNNSRIALYGQYENHFGARINRPTSLPETESIPAQDDSVVINAEDPNVNIVYPANFDQVINVHSTLQSNIVNPSISGSDSINSQGITQRYLFPASTIPLDEHTPAHYFAGVPLATAASPLIHVQEDSVHTAHFHHVPVAPIDYSVPIAHDINILH